MNLELMLNVNGAATSYHDSAKKTLPVIFIHGFPFRKSCWDPQFEFLKETHRVITYDLPGFGRSSPLNTEASIAAYAEHLIKFMDGLHLEKAIVCGLSMGGYILLNAAERYTERFSAIILCDTQCLADSKENVQKRYDTIKTIEEKGPEEFAEGFLRNTLTEHTHKHRAELVENVRSMILSNNQEAVTAALRAMAGRKETCSGLKDIRIPALILCGEEDALTPASLSEFMFNHIPNAELRILPKAGHLSNLEAPDTFNDHLHNFISDIII